MSVEAKSALISTASVEIKTLTLNGKQMTLSVFRQLPRAVPRDGVVGRLWGVVNYHPDAECKGLYESEHLHVVSDHQGQLVRTFVVDPDLRAEVFHSHTYKCGHRQNLHRGLRECFLPMEDDWGNDIEMYEWGALCGLPQLFIAV